MIFSTGLSFGSETSVLSTLLGVESVLIDFRENVQLDISVNIWT